MRCYVETGWFGLPRNSLGLRQLSDTEFGWTTQEFRMVDMRAY